MSKTKEKMGGIWLTFSEDPDFKMPEAPMDNDWMPTSKLDARMEAVYGKCIQKIPKAAQTDICPSLKRSVLLVLWDLVEQLEHVDQVRYVASLLPPTEIFTWGRYRSCRETCVHEMGVLRGIGVALGLSMEDVLALALETDPKAKVFLEHVCGYLNKPLPFKGKAINLEGAYE